MGLAQAARQRILAVMALAKPTLAKSSLTCCVWCGVVWCCVVLCMCVWCGVCVCAVWRGCLFHGFMEWGFTCGCWFQSFGLIMFGAPGLPFPGPPKISLFFFPHPAAKFVLFFPGRRGFTRQPENSIRAHLSAPALQTPPKFHEKTPREGRKKRILRRERKKKTRMAPTLRAPTFGPPPFGPPTFSGLGPPPFSTLPAHTIGAPTPLDSPPNAHPTPGQQRDHPRQLNTHKKKPEQLISKNPINSQKKIFTYNKNLNFGQSRFGKSRFGKSRFGQESVWPKWFRPFWRQSRRRR